MRRPGFLLVAASVGAIAFAARLVPVLHGAGLSSILFYDDGVYYTAAHSLTFGRLPYREFVLLHPPGVAIVVAPFAVLGRLTSDTTGLEVARLAFMGVGAATAVLVALTGDRLSRTAAWVAGLFYALWWPASHNENSTLLEPLVNLGLAASLVLLGDPRDAGRRRLLVAGALIGAACSVKLWAFAPLLVLAVWIGVRSRPASAGWFSLGAAGVFAAVTAPFLAFAPTAMPRMVVLDQLKRTATGVGTGARLADILAIRQVSPTALPTGLAVVAVALAAAVLAVAVVVAVRVPMARPWAALLGANVATLLGTASFFPKYSDFAAVPLALMAGAAVEAAVSWAREQEHRRWAAVAAVAVAATVIGAFGLAALRDPVGRSGHGAWLNARLSASRCVVADDPIALIQADVLTRDLGRGCEVVPDTTGTSYDLAHSHPPGSDVTANRRTNGEWQAWMTDYLLDQNAFVLARPNATGFTKATLACLHSQHQVARLRGTTVYAAPGGGANESRAVESAEMGRGTGTATPGLLTRC